MNYSSTGIIALIIHLVINNDVMRRKDEKDLIPAYRYYRAFLLSVAGYFVSDILWGFLYEWQLITLTIIDTVLYFLAMACSILFWTRFVIAYLNKDNTFSKLLSGTGWLIFIIQTILSLLSLFRPVMFSFDEQGVYHAERARYIILIAQIGMFLVTAAYTMTIAAKSEGNEKNRYRTIWLSSLAMAGFIIAQAWYPLIPMYAVGCLLCSCLLHSYVLEDVKEEYRSGLETKLQESIQKGNYFDLLTGLPSMTYFFDLADSGKAAVVQKGGKPVFLYMDFTGMKFFNNKYGFAEGDKLLQSFAKTLVQTFGEGHCCRISGDQFAVITLEDEMEEKLNLIFSECKTLNDGRSLPIHVGIYPDRFGEVSAGIACDRAKMACNELRGVYTSCFKYYNQRLGEGAEKTHYIAENIDRAVAEGWIKVYYQPIVRAITRKACEEEALARWIDPVMGFLSPADFIPALEESGQIYKLDLFMLEQVLLKMQYQKTAGITIFPNSINLSRSDFESCDIVEEIRKRVDAAGISHDKITIEITESIIGSDPEFMKEQITRFRSLGFPVWMDDFGSGYSSLDVLQSLKFDMLKFDMGFMQRLDEDENGRIVLTELMQMATSLGLSTVCEGVETEEQASFLQEIGCSRLQGFLFSKPQPFEKDMLKLQTGYENPEESPYYDAIGSVNLYDLSSIVSKDENGFRNFFNTLPMSILEVKEDTAQYIRSNQSYRDFMKRYFNMEISGNAEGFPDSTEVYGSNFIQAVRQCCADKNRAFFDEKLPDGSMAHCFIRRIGRNAVSGKTASAIAVLSITEPDEGASYADIARALAADYYNIYIIDLDTENFIEYTSPVGKDELAMERHGTGFFESAKQAAMTRIYEDDREPFLSTFTKENVIRELDEQGTFTAAYRLIDSGKPTYVSMKITRMQPGGNRVILGVSIIDAQMKQKELFQKKKRQS